MSKPLDQLLSDGIIDSVISRLKTGKEAEIYLVEHKGEIVAAKIYKEQHARNFKHRAQYGEGRTVRNSRTQRALNKGSRFGKASEEEAWKATESDALHKLHAAGLRVPQPVLFYEGILLMEVVIDAEGHPAPRLIDAQVPKEKAAELYFDLRAQAIKMLCADIIHGDLSPYNVLMAWNGPTIIDFPQVVGAAHNQQAASFFERDLRALQKHFASIDPALHGHADDARQIWKAYTKRELTPDFEPVWSDRPPQKEEAAPGGRREWTPGQGQRGGGHRGDRGGPGHGGQRAQHGERHPGGAPQGHGDRRQANAPGERAPGGHHRGDGDRNRQQQGPATHGERHQGGRRPRGHGGSPGERQAGGGKHHGHAAAHGSAQQHGPAAAHTDRQSGGKQHGHADRQPQHS
ncbi:MAG: RIO1 family regulatory kinase/ATPase, partial [Myxococcaceae bacterium]